MTHLRVTSPPRPSVTVRRLCTTHGCSLRAITIAESLEFRHEHSTSHCCAHWMRPKIGQRCMPTRNGCVSLRPQGANATHAYPSLDCFAEGWSRYQTRDLRKQLRNADDTTDATPSIGSDLFRACGGSSHRQDFESLAASAELPRACAARSESSEQRKSQNRPNSLEAPTTATYSQRVLAFDSAHEYQAGVHAIRAKFERPNPDKKS